tara:strand:- start:193 stop:474 length:282 start_codon:yes stop_codon:yes gene_type:complete
MTPEEQAHMRMCIIEFSDLMEKKYIRGQQEHSGSLWLKPQTNNIVEEVVDLAHYVMTKRQQEGILRSLVEAALKSDDAEIKDATLNRVLELLP